MKKMELEVKVLDIDKDKLIKKLENLGAIKKEESIQKMYTYDLVSISARYMDILLHIDYYINEKSVNENNELKLLVVLDKIKGLFKEVDYLLDDNDRNKLSGRYNVDNLNDLCEKDNVFDIVNSSFMKRFINRFFLSPKKWLRLRENNGVVEITVKHILPKVEGLLQQLEETEIIVPNMDDADELLESLGFYHKFYWEKERISYELNGYLIDIDTWPEIPTYIEIEGESEESLAFILGKIDFSIKDAISCTADDVFRMYGKSMFDVREMKFIK